MSDVNYCQYLCNKCMKECVDHRFKCSICLDFDLCKEVSKSSLRHDRAYHTQIMYYCQKKLRDLVRTV